ncbi:hypothetical protein POM88_036537 [Heracleum sosnowskyi]|uniref:Helitron helicase-like domain-containing protein n=1 Tax=Heracleum sosnowskyi TaxID=360622 RepID=A0AAD8HND0_9APIA|nr:hypothetical protein POM88_036537 [Heracleum sosnowskyi]
MDRTPNKGGRPKVFLTKDVVKRQKMLKKRRNDSRRKLHDMVPGGSTQAAGTPAPEQQRGNVEAVPHEHSTVELAPGVIQGEGIQSIDDGSTVTENLLGQGNNGGVPEQRKLVRGPDSGVARGGGVETNTVLDVGRQEETCGFCAAQVWAAEFTGRHVGPGPKGYSICCEKGKVQLPLLRQTPPELNELLTSGGTSSRMFFNKSRIYNNIFAFCSFGGNVDHSVNSGKGPYVFRVSGRTYHSLGSLVPPDGLTPKYAQLYMYDSKEALEHRVNFPGKGGEVDPNVVSMLQEMLDRENVLVGVFNQLRNRFTDVDPEPVRLRLLERRTTDGRFKNMLTENDYEFAGLAVDNDFANHRDVVAENKRVGLQHIICREYGHPDLFITFTCNPKWEEIQSAVRSSGAYDASVRPDLVARVFKMKLDAMITDFTKNRVLGRVIAVVYTIEFQKRVRTHAFGDDIDPSWIKIPDEVLINYTGDAVEAIVNEIYKDLQGRHGDVEYLRDRAILTPLNEDVENVNVTVLKRLPGEFKTYKSCDTICKASSTSEADEVLYPPEYLNSLKFSVFGHGQIYVAISRVTSPDGLKIVCVNENDSSAGYTKNIVYREIFDDIM